MVRVDEEVYRQQEAPQEWTSLLWNKKDILLCKCAKKQITMKSEPCCDFIVGISDVANSSPNLCTSHRTTDWLLCFTGFDVNKVGDARVGLVGFPSVGKSTLLTKLTGTMSEVSTHTISDRTMTAALCLASA